MKAIGLLLAGGLLAGCQRADNSDPAAPPYASQTNAANRRPGPTPTAPNVTDQTNYVKGTAVATNGHSRPNANEAR